MREQRPLSPRLAKVGGGVGVVGSEPFPGNTERHPDAS